jgi:hypothetical protein
MSHLSHTNKIFTLQSLFHSKPQATTCPLTVSGSIILSHVYQSSGKSEWGEHTPRQLRHNLALTSCTEPSKQDSSAAGQRLWFDASSTQATILQ